MNIRYPIYEGVYRILTFNLAFNLEIRCKKREKKRPLKTLSRFVLRCPVLSTNRLFYSIINHRYFAAE